MSDSEREPPVESLDDIDPDVHSGETILKALNRVDTVDALDWLEENPRSEAKAVEYAYTLLTPLRRLNDIRGVSG